MHKYPGFGVCPECNKKRALRQRPSGQWACRRCWEGDPLTTSDAQAAYDASPAVPLSEERIQEIVTYAVESAGPETHEEARQFHEGFLAGATAYAAAVGHSGLKSDNAKLREVFDAQGWRTIETFERLAAVPVVCEHGVKDGEWCEPCNHAYKDAATRAES